MSGSIINYFTSDDCSFWLKQMAQAQRSAIRDRFYGREEMAVQTQPVELEIKILQGNLAASCVLLFSQISLTLYQGHRLGYSHVITVFWILMQLPSIFSMLKIADTTHYSEKGSNKMKFISDSFENAGLHLFDNQLSTLCLITILWITIGRFKRVLVQVVQDD